MMDLPSISTDQLSALVALSTKNSIRSAAKGLHITEQGLRNRLLALEQRLGATLYHRVSGRRETHLTGTGQLLLPHALEILDRARLMREHLSSTPMPAEIVVVASQYLAYYVLIAAIGSFHEAERIRLSTRSEREIHDLLQADSHVGLAIAAPYEVHPDIEFAHLFSLDWFVITAEDHEFEGRDSVSLADVVNQPLILFERGSAGRQHVLEAFRNESLSPHVEMEATNTQTVVRMVEAGLGISIVPLFADGRITDGSRVTIHPIDEAVRPIRSGVLTRRDFPLSAPARAFIEFVRRESPAD